MVGHGSSQVSPPPGICHPIEKNAHAMPGGSPGLGGGGGGRLGGGRVGGGVHGGGGGGGRGMLGGVGSPKID